MKKFLALVLVLCSLTVASQNANAGPDDLAYFKQFLYRVDADTSDPDFPEYTYFHLGTFWNFKIPLSTTHYMTIPTAFYLNDNRTYEASYKEQLWKNDDTWMPGSKCLKFTGTWGVPDKTLLIYKDGEVIAEGVRSTWSGQHAVTFTFHKAIINPAIVGKVVQATIVQGNVSKDNPSPMPCF